MKTIIEEELKRNNIKERIRDTRTTRNPNKYCLLEPMGIKVLEIIIGEDSEIPIQEYIIVRLGLSPHNNGMLQVHGTSKSLSQYLEIINKEIGDCKIVSKTNLIDILPKELLEIYEYARNKAIRENESLYYRACLDILSVIWMLLNKHKLSINEEIITVLQNNKIKKIYSEESGISYIYNYTGNSQSYEIEQIQKKHKKKKLLCYIEEISLLDILTIEEQILYKYSHEQSKCGYITRRAIIDAAVKRLKDNDTPLKKDAIPVLMYKKRLLKKGI